MKLVLTLSDDSFNYDYLRKINCRFLELRTSEETKLNIIHSYQHRRFFVVG